MRKELVTLRDTLIGYTEPSCFPNLEVAKRDFTASYKNHPNKDYMQLWHLGTYDTETAEIDTCIPELIMKGVDIYG